VKGEEQGWFKYFQERGWTMGTSVLFINKAIVD
jgi:hypothetical protein